jgi:hypothetical protein
MAGPVMISEIEFIRDHTSFWRQIAPLSEDFVRRVNLAVLDRYDSEIISKIDVSRRALVNEVGFDIFASCCVGKSKLKDMSRDEVDMISNKASQRISRLRAGGPIFSPSLTPGEFAEARDIAEKLASFFGKFTRLEVHPKFNGCGQIDSCYGDVLADDVLYEVKSGGRQFRSVDLRQLVLYMALSRASKQYCVRSLGLYNPRQGFHFSLPCDSFSIEFSGLSAEELCHKIIYQLGSQDFYAGA